MRTAAILSLTVGLSALTAAPESAADPLVGKWEAVSVLRGDVPDKDNLRSVREHTDGGRYTITPAPGSKSPKVEGTYTVDATKSPAHVNFKPTTGRYKDRTLLGLYKVEGGVLTIIFADPGNPRPTDFEPHPDRILWVHKKIK